MFQGFPTTRRPRFCAALAAFALLTALGAACSFGGASFEQIPPSVREAVARSEANGGPYADPPLERYPRALVDGPEIVERLEGLETRVDTAERERAAVRDVALAEGASSRDRDATLEEVVRVESDVAREGRARIAADVAQLEVRTDATEEGVDELGGEIATSQEQDSARDARLIAIETSVQDLGAELDARFAALEEPGTEPEFESRLDSIELALADLRTERENAARVEDIDGLRADLATLRDGLARAANPDATSTAMLTAGSNGYFALGWGDTALLVIVLVVIVLLVLNVVRLRAERERDRHSRRLFGRIEDAVRALDEHVARQAARDDDSRRAGSDSVDRSTRTEDEGSLVANGDDATAARAQVHEPAESSARADAATPTEVGGGRWERFVERVESPAPSSEEPPLRFAPPTETEQPHAPGTRRKRVLDRSFLERYRGRGTDAGSRS